MCPQSSPSLLQRLALWWGMIVSDSLRALRESLSNSTVRIFDGVGVRRGQGRIRAAASSSLGSSSFGPLARGRCLRQGLEQLLTSKRGIHDEVAAAAAAALGS